MQSHEKWLPIKVNYSNFQIPASKYFYEHEQHHTSFIYIQFGKQTCFNLQQDVKRFEYISTLLKRARRGQKK